MSSRLMIIATLVVALILAILPIPVHWIWFRPEWVTLVVAYWVLNKPELLNIGTAWLIGIIMDGLYGSLLGVHALGLIIPMYILEKIHSVFNNAPIVKQCGWIMIIVLVQQSLVFAMQSFMGQVSIHHWFWMPAITSGLIWPIVALVLSGCRIEAKTAH